MRPLQFSVVLGSLCFLLSSYVVGQQDVAEIVKRSSDAVVLIVISDSSGQETALGSGFIVSADGEVVTNYHVIKDAHSAVAKLSNGAFLPVSGILAFDSDKDLAIIKVNGKNLPFLSIGAGDKVRPGDHVVAIGSPLGLEGTVSDGIVSAFREIADKKWIQTTAPVSHGNSGGPLLDMKNKVIGVITWGVNLELGQNLNFAVPSDEVASLLVSAQKQVKPLDSVLASSEGGSVLKVSHWTSMTGGRDFDVRQDGDYVYTECVSLPVEVTSHGGFARSELKKTADGKWRGKLHINMPCTYQKYGQNVTKWCPREDDYEIDLLSEKRIEGVGLKWKKFDCKKCEPAGTEPYPFVWIPK